MTTRTRRFSVWLQRHIGMFSLVPEHFAARAVSINNHAQIVGSARTANGQSHAVLWQEGQITDLGTLPGQHFSDAQDINTHGQIVGWSFAPTRDGYQRQAVLWQDRELIALATLPGHLHSAACAINDHGQIVGWASIRGSKTRAVRWEGGRIVDLGGPLDDPWGSDIDINVRGQVVGSRSGCAFLLQDGRFIELHPLPESDCNVARAINGSGQIVGTSGPCGEDQHAVLWQDGRVIDLGTLPGYPESEARAINDRGQVVGKSSFALNDECFGLYDQTECTDPFRATLWEQGALIDLGTLPDGRDSAAHAINDHGQIVGMAITADEKEHAVLWDQGQIIDLGSLTNPGYRTVDSPPTSA